VSVVVHAGRLRFEMVRRGWSVSDLARESRLSAATISAALAGRPMAAKSLIGRRTDGFVDALIFGAQVTLQNDPASVTAPMPRTRHFGATVSWDAWESISARLRGGPLIVEPPTLSYVGEPTEKEN